MIAALDFTAPARRSDGRVLREAVFRRRSSLPLSAACVVANGVREQLAQLLAAELDVELVEPSIPGPEVRRILVAGATIVRVRGRICDGFVIVRAADARRLVALAFRESERPEADPLSEIERTTVERIVTALVPLCTSLCGTLGAQHIEHNERAACDLVTYFEVRTTGALGLAIGFALARDPVEEVGERLSLTDLGGVELEGVVDFGSGRVGIPAFSRLAVGTTVPLEGSLAGGGVLRFGGIAFARGTCGVSNGRTAIVLDGAVR
ncbi:MAG: FliM/FliN family flagellar motor switch protein [Candidatus Eremiobacteraeota bacterium]|nr:FliM/FliN family flagellar motor switch protein [Candidatus Eremiobacteraeota bacterium]